MNSLIEKISNKEKLLTLMGLLGFAAVICTGDIVQTIESAPVPIITDISSELKPTQAPTETPTPRSTNTPRPTKTEAPIGGPVYPTSTPTIEPSPTPPETFTPEPTLTPTPVPTETPIPFTPTLEPTIALPTWTPEPPPPTLESTSIPSTPESSVNNPRKTGQMTMVDGHTGDYCRGEDGRLSDELDNGQPTGRKVMHTHIVSVNSGSSITVWNDETHITFNNITQWGVTRPNYHTDMVNSNFFANEDCVLITGATDDLAKSVWRLGNYGD